MSARDALLAACTTGSSQAWTACKDHMHALVPCFQFCRQGQLGFEWRVIARNCSSAAGAMFGRTGHLAVDIFRGEACVKNDLGGICVSTT